MQGPLRSNYQPIDANDKLVVSDDIGGEFVRSASLVGGIVTIIYQDAAGIEQMISFTASGAAPPTPSMHARYFGWSADRTIATSDFSSATTSTTNVGALPTVVTGGFVWFAVPQSQGYPTHIYLQGNTQDQGAFWEQLAGTVDDATGEAHIVGISFRSQTSNLSGLTMTLGY